MLPAMLLCEGEKQSLRIFIKQTKKK